MHVHNRCAAVLKQQTLHPWLVGLLLYEVTCFLNLPILVDSCFSEVENFSPLNEYAAKRELLLVKNANFDSRLMPLFDKIVSRAECVRSVVDKSAQKYL